MGFWLDWILLCPYVNALDYPCCQGQQANMQLAYVYSGCNISKWSCLYPRDPWWLIQILIFDITMLVVRRYIVDQFTLKKLPNHWLWSLAQKWMRTILDDLNDSCNQLSYKASYNTFVHNWIQRGKIASKLNIPKDSRKKGKILKNLGEKNRSSMLAHCHCRWHHQ